MLVQVVDSYTGAICGTNAGSISFATAQIYIDSLGYAGGITGVNTESGTITDSINFELIVSYRYDYESSVWGLVNINHGTVVDCHNYGQVFDRKAWVYVEG